MLSNRRLKSTFSTWAVQEPNIIFHVMESETQRLAVGKLKLLRWEKLNWTSHHNWQLRPGYMIHERTLRAAKVGVTKWGSLEKILEDERICEFELAVWLLEELRQKGQEPVGLGGIRINYNL